MKSPQELVSFVEPFCDLLEESLPVFKIYDRSLSVPATVAAMRAFYYVENDDSTNSREKKTMYNQLHFILTDDRIKWSSLKVEEQKALLDKLVISRILVFYSVV
jgi:hypothetical protein